jgi:multidrug efflux pump
VFSRFFIDRPIFAAVLSLVIFFAGLVAVGQLPVAQYPQITPPSIIVSCNYPGASAKVVAESVAAPIEQQVNGVENMIYMSSQSANDGSYTLTVTFKPGVDLNFAQVLVQNRVNLALPLLPDVVKQTGLTTRKRNPDILLIASIYSPHGRYDQIYLSNFATLQIADELRRVDGVGDVFLFGQQDYSMRVWLDPDLLASLNLTAGDVVAALREQNLQVAAGEVGQPPVSGGRPFAFTVSTLGRLSEPEQFADVVLRVGDDGRKVHIRDVGHVELGARNQDVASKLDVHPCTSLAIFQLPYANAIATADRVRQKMEELKRTFPEDVDYEIAFDTTPFVKESIWEVIRTLVLAVVLVAAVVLVFLQNWRSTVIPLAAVPVAIVGTFAAMAAIGFSLNMLTLFGLVLAIGIVVDDAIVVVEAVEHHIETGLSPRRAAYKAMEQVSGPVVAVALVLSAVFVPCAFISGITGQFFRQFALTIAVSTVISAFNSLTLSPALAAILLQAKGAKKDFFGRFLDLTLGWFFWLFNWGFRASTGVYTRVVGLALRLSIVVMIVYVGLLALTWWGFTRLPTGYIPNQDQGRLFAAIQLPDSASLQRTQEVADHVTDLAHRTPGVAHTISVAGQSFVLGANGSNFGNLFIPLVDFDKRPYYDEAYPEADPPKPHRRMTSNDVTEELKAAVNKEIPEAFVTVLGPPPVSGLGSTGGFKLIVEDRSGDGDLEKLQKETEKLIAASRASPKVEFVKAVVKPGPKQEVESAANRPGPTAGESAGRALPLGEAGRAEAAQEKSDPVKADAQPAAAKGDQPAVGSPGDPRLTGLLTVFRANSPQLYVDLNRAQCQTMGVNPSDVFTTLQVYLGSLYVNDFNQFGRTWQVVVQAEGVFRNDPESIKRLMVRNVSGQMVPLGSVLTVREIGGPIILTRYNMYPAAAIVGGTRPGVSSGEGIAAMQKLADQTLSKGMSYEWTEINWIQIDAAKSPWNNLIFPLAVVFVFLVLAAQYESWALPLAVILVVPMCILGSLTGVYLTHADINIFTQVGFVVLVGLASKNAILIVEFAKHQREAGLSRRDATLAACKLRLRPILMTSFAFILGVVPLITATGAGSEMRRLLGTAVFSGMLGVTIFGVFLTPVFFFILEWISETSLFAAAPTRAVGKAMLFGVGILTLGMPWWLPVVFGRASRRPGPPAATRRRAPANGAAAPPTDGAPNGTGVAAEEGETPSKRGN